MADFKVQRGSVTIADANTVHTALVAGTDYDAPIGEAFVRITGIASGTDGTQHGDFSGSVSNSYVYITDPTNLSTNLQFQRDNTQGAVDIQYEIIEYIGAASGANEFKVRYFNNLDMAGNVDLTVDTGTIATIVDKNDVCPIICAQGPSDGAGAWSRTLLNALLAEATVVDTAGDISVELARGANGGSTVIDARYSLAVIEFTGSNWTVEKVRHTYTSGNTNETETLTNTLGATSRGFISGVYGRFSGVNTDMQSISDSVYISSTTQLTFNRSELDGLYDTVDAWVVSNSATGDGAMNVSTRVTNGTRLTNAGGGVDPDIWNETVTTLTAPLSETSVMGISGGVTTNGTQDSHMILIGMRLTSTTNLRLSRGRDFRNRKYTYEIVEWPDANTGTKTINSNFFSLTNQLYQPTLANNTQYRTVNFIISGNVKFNPILQEALPPFDYPQNVPICPLRGTFSNNAVNTVLESNISGLPNTRNRHTGKLCAEKWQVRMNSSELDILMSWYHNTLKRVFPFTIADPVSQEVKEYYFVTPPSSVHAGGDYYIVTFDLEMNL